MMAVRLSDDQRAAALDAARAKEAHVRTIPGARHRFDDGVVPVRRDTLAYEAEIAASIATGIPWRGFRDITQCYEGDLEGRIEVRRRRRPGDALLIRPEDKAPRPYILVTGADGLYDVRGWAYGDDVWTVGEWWADAPHRPCWRLPQRVLRDIRELGEDRGGRGGGA